MMTHNEALEFAKSSADMALDHIGSKDFEDPIASFRENVIDTLRDERAAEHTAEALEIYDAYIATHKVEWAV